MKEQEVPDEVAQHLRTSGCTKIENPTTLVEERAEMNDEVIEQIFDLPDKKAVFELKRVLQVAVGMCKAASDRRRRRAMGWQ